MSGKNFLNYFIILAILIVTVSCAKMVPPSGGPKDVDPPVVIKSIPPQKSINYSGKTILITFNEYVTFDKLNEKFMISPPVEKKPSITLRGKTMRIELPEILKDSTTYTLYFQDAIRDLNEGNPLVNFQFVFSTGSHIDSLSITGNVYLAHNLNPEKNVLVMLHSNMADTAPRKLLPDYVTIADDKGYFRINNIKSGKYKLYALLDNNSNKMYDLDDEYFAFYNEIIDINPASHYISSLDDSLKRVSVPDSLRSLTAEEGEYKLYLFKAPPKKFYLTSTSRSMPYRLQYTLSKPPDSLDFSFKLFDEEGIFFIERNAGRDTLTVWLTDSLLWSEQELKTLVRYPYTDSTGIVVSRVDTVRMRYFEAKQVRGKEQRSMLKVESNIAGGQIKPGQAIMFSSSTPLKPPDTSLIRLYLIDKDIKKRITYKLVVDTLSSLRYFLNAGFSEGMKYQLRLERGAFSNIYGTFSDSTVYTFTIRTESSFGHLTVVVQNGTGNMVIQLLDGSEKVVTEGRISDAGSVVFPMLEKGRYRLRVIYDFNNDGRWTTGNYDILLQPEPVSYYPEEIDVKTDWRIEQEWDVAKKNQKSNHLRDNRSANR